MDHAVLDMFKIDLNTVGIEEQRKVYLHFKRIVINEIMIYVKDRHQQEEVIQMSFLKTTIHMAKRNHHPNIKAWIKRIAKNTAIDYCRKNNRIHKHEIHNLETILLDPRYNFLYSKDIFPERVTIKLLYFCINELNAEYRKLIIDHYFVGKSYFTLQNELKISESVLTQRLARSRKKLSQLFHLYL